MASKTNENKVGVAIAGLGFGEKVHLPALHNNEMFKPIGLWHPRKDRLKESCKKNNLIPYDNWASLLNDEHIKGIIIATPPEPRFQLAIEALQSGKHLLLEKPVAITSEQIRSLQCLAIKNKLSVCVDFEYRAVPIFMQLKRMLDNNVIGNLWLVKLDWLMSSRADENRPWNWYSQKEKGGGVIGALGTHAFDLLHWLFGQTKYVSGYTSTSIKQRNCPKNNELKEVTSEDICLAQLELSSILSNTNIPAQVTLSSVSRQGRGCWLEIYGSNGTLILGSDNQKDYIHGFSLWFAEKGKTIIPIKPDKDLIFDKTWEDGRVAPVSRIQNWWGHSILGNTPIIPGLNEGLSSQIVCEKIISSNYSKMSLFI